MVNNARGLASENLKIVVGPMSKSIEASVSKSLNTTGEYPEAELLLKPVYGVGTLIALSFLLMIEDPQRFAHSRDIEA